MLNPAPWALVLGIAGLLTAGMYLSVRNQRRCPSCRTELIALQAPEGRSYEVLACPACPGSVTLAVGHRARFSWCPDCKQRSLQTPCLRRPEPDGNLVVEIHEHCHLCPHDEIVIVTAPAPPRGLVVPFPPKQRARGGE